MCVCMCVHHVCVCVCVCMCVHHVCVCVYVCPSRVCVCVCERGGIKLTIRESPPPYGCIYGNYNIMLCDRIDLLGASFSVFHIPSFYEHLYITRRG